MSGWTSSPETITVELGECLCPGTPHQPGDWVRLRSELSLEGGLAVLAEMSSSARGSVIERLGRAYLRFGIVEWSFLAEDGEPLPVTDEVIANLRWSAGIFRLADRAADLYAEAVLIPLQVRESSSLPTGRSAGSTSPTRPSSSKRPKR